MDRVRAAGRDAGTPLVPSIAADEKKHQEWEYEYLEDLGTDPKARLNELGKEGWGLISANPFIFRRPKLEENKERPRVGFGR